MKRVSRLVAAMVALAVVLTGVVFAETQGTIAERYQDALSRLERYLMNLQDDSVNITTLAEDFQKLGNYEGSNAFYYYTLGLAEPPRERRQHSQRCGMGGVPEWAYGGKRRELCGSGGAVSAVPELHGRAEPHSVCAGVESADLRGGDTCPDSGAYVCAE